MKTGTCITNPECPPAATFDVELRGGAIWVSSRTRWSDGAVEWAKADANAIQIRLVKRGLARVYGDEG